jgi:hypothetical protein
VGKSLLGLDQQALKLCRQNIYRRSKLRQRQRLGKTDKAVVIHAVPIEDEVAGAFGAFIL